MKSLLRIISHIKAEKIILCLGLLSLLAIAFDCEKSVSESVTLKRMNGNPPVINLKSLNGQENNQEQIVTISLAGDCSLGKLSVHGYEGTFAEMYDKNGAGYFFKNVKSIFEADDMTLVNFEGVLTESDQIVEKQYNIKGRPEYKQILT